MSGLNKIMEVQDRILESLATCEAKIGELYAAYESHFPDMGNFWNKLAKEERKHAALIEEVRSDLEDGIIMQGMGHFTVKEVQTLIDYVQDGITELQSSRTTAVQAVSIALSIESSVIDSHFFDFAKSNGSAFQRVAQQLAHETQEHIKMVQEARLELVKIR
jgi:hypothetical protein